MDAKTFLDNFATIAEAPGGLQRLRELVLELAVRGRLVEQRREDEPASAGLDAVRADKGDTLADSIRGGGAVPRIPEPAEHDGDLPPGWECARVDDTGDYVNGLAFKNSDWKPAGIPIIRIQNLTNPSVPFNYADGPFPEDRMAHDGDILVSWSATLNAFRWHRGDAVVNQHIFKVIPDHRVVTTDYLFHLLRYCIRAMADGEAAHGLVMKHINRGPFLSHVISLPPLAEQERIVAKVDELTGLIHDLESRQERRHRATARFRASSLHALAEAETPEELSNAWKRVGTNWPTMTSHADGTQAIREAVLELAMQGRLVAQRPEHGSMPSFLASRGKKLTPSPPGEYAPPEWAWTRLDALLQGALANGRSVPTQDGGFPVLRLTCLKDGLVDLAERKGGAWTAEEAEPFRVQRDDFLVARGNGSLSLVGRGGLVSSEPDHVAFPDTLIRVQVDPELLAPALLRWWWNSPLVRRQLEPLARTTSGLYKVNQQLLSSVRLPVPPPDEQPLVVDALQAFMGMCDRLGSALLRLSRNQEALAAAATHASDEMLTA